MVLASVHVRRTRSVHLVLVSLVIPIAQRVQADLSTNARVATRIFQSSRMVVASRLVARTSTSTLPHPHANLAMGVALVALVLVQITASPVLALAKSSAVEPVSQLIVAVELAFSQV